MERASRDEAEWRRKKKVLTDGLTPGDARGKLRWRRAGKPPSPSLASEFVLYGTPWSVNSLCLHCPPVHSREASEDQQILAHAGYDPGRTGNRAGTTYLLRAHRRAQGIEM